MSKPSQSSDFYTEVPPADPEPPMEYFEVPPTGEDAGRHLQASVSKNAHGKSGQPAASDKEK